MKNKKYLLQKVEFNGIYSFLRKIQMVNKFLPQKLKP